MQPIHLDPDTLRLAARMFQQEYDHLVEGVFLLRIQYYRLEMDWQGGAAEEYLYELAALLKRMEQQMNGLLTLSLTLARQADAWEELDQRWAGAYRERIVLQTGVTTDVSRSRDS